MPRTRMPLPSVSKGAKMFSLELAGLRDARGRFASFADKGAVGYARELTREMGRVYVKHLREEAPVGKHYTWRGEPIEPTKRLRDSFTFKTFVREDRIDLNVYSSVKHVRWVVRGVYPYKRGRRPIRPKRAAALAFWWAKKRKSVVCSVVMHPGSLSNLFHERAFERAEPEIERIRRRTARWMLRSLSWPKPGAGGQVV